MNQLEIFDSHYVIACPNEHLGIIVNMDEENGFDKKNGIFKVGIAGYHLLTPLLIYSAIGSITDMNEYCGVRFVNPHNDKYCFENDKGVSIPLWNSSFLLPGRYSITIT